MGPEVVITNKLSIDPGSSTHQLVEATIQNNTEEAFFNFRGGHSHNDMSLVETSPL